MFERFAPPARRVLVLAQEEARQLDHGFIGTEHLLLGLIHEGEGVAARAIGSFGIALDAVRDSVRTMVGAATPAGEGALRFTPRAKRVLELALREAFEGNHRSIGTEHLLLGLLREGEGPAVQLLSSMGAEPEPLRHRVMTLAGVLGRLLTPGPPSGPHSVGRPLPRTALPGQVQAQNLRATAMDASEELERLGLEVVRLQEENVRLRARLATGGVDPHGVREPDAEEHLAGGGAGDDPHDAPDTGTSP